MTVFITKARNLIIKDKSLIGTGSSDPFIKVTVNGQTKQTKTVMKNLNPVFNERLEFVFDAAPASVELAVFDWDRASAADPMVRGAACFLCSVSRPS